MKDINHKIVIYQVGFAFFFVLYSCLSTQLLSMNRTVAGSKPPETHSAEVRLPNGYHLPGIQKLHLQGKDIAIDLFSSGFAQGSAVYAEIYNNPGRDVELSVVRFFFNDKELLFAKRIWGYRSVFGIDPGSVTGNNRMDITYALDKAVRTESFNVPVKKTEYPFNPTPLDLGKYSDVDYKLSPADIAFIEKCSAKKKIAFGRAGSDRLGSSLSHPLEKHAITSPFWAQRLVMQYRKKSGKKIFLKNKLNIHRGLDLRGNTGDPVYSVADGQVVISELMYYEGNFVVVDHGNRMFSYYMHLNDLKVKEGEIVRAGDLLGHVGSSGMSTASHLHFAILLQNIYVDPLSILVLPLRN
jgi:hypothetical protein